MFGSCSVMQYLVTFLVLQSSRRLVAVSVLCLFFSMPWVSLQCVIVVFPGHTHLLFKAMFLTLTATAAMTTI